MTRLTECAFIIPKVVNKRPSLFILNGLPNVDFGYPHTFENENSSCNAAIYSLCDFVE